MATIIVKPRIKLFTISAINKHDRIFYKRTFDPIDLVLIKLIFKGFLRIILVNFSLYAWLLCQNHAVLFEAERLFWLSLLGSLSRLNFEIRLLWEKSFHDIGGSVCNLQWILLYF